MPITNRVGDVGPQLKPRWVSKALSDGRMTSPFRARSHFGGSRASVVVQKFASFSPRVFSSELLNLNHTRIIGLLVSFESEVRYEVRCTMRRTSDSGH